MARPRQRTFRIKLNESAGTDREAVARALQTWAILLADHAQRVVVHDLRQEPRTTSRHDDGERSAAQRHRKRVLGRTE